MDAAAADLARRAAEDLAQLDPGLVPLVEAEIQAQGRDQRPERFDATTAIGLATLLLMVAQFVYQIHRDRRADARLSADVLRRQVRVQLDQDGHPDTARRQAVIDAVIRAVEQARP